GVVDHLGRGLPGLDAARPGFVAARELAERGRDGARRLAAELVAADAAIGLDDVEELALALDVRVDAVAGWTSARERRGFRHLDHRIPVDRRIVFRRGFLVGRLHGGGLELRSGPAVAPRGGLHAPRA